jgi:hypothetical protein
MRWSVICLLGAWALSGVGACSGTRAADVPDGGDSGADSDIAADAAFPVVPPAAPDITAGAGVEMTRFVPVDRPRGVSGQREEPRQHGAPRALGRAPLHVLTASPRRLEPWRASYLTGRSGPVQRP